MAPAPKQVFHQSFENKKLNITKGAMIDIDKITSLLNSIFINKSLSKIKMLKIPELLKIVNLKAPAKNPLNFY